MSTEIAGFRGLHFKSKMNFKVKKTSAGHCTKQSMCIKSISLTPFTAKGIEGYIGYEKGGQKSAGSERFIIWYLAGKWYKWIQGIGGIYKGTNTLSLFCPGLSLAVYYIEMAYLYGLQQYYMGRSNAGPPAMLNINNMKIFVEENRKER